nr:MetaGeneMark_Unknown Function [uncultured bacterium]
MIDGHHSRNRFVRRAPTVAIAVPAQLRQNKIVSSERYQMGSRERGDELAGAFRSAAVDRCEPPEPEACRAVGQLSADE